MSSLLIVLADQIARTLATQRIRCAGSAYATATAQQSRSSKAHRRRRRRRRQRQRHRPAPTARKASTNSRPYCNPQSLGLQSVWSVGCFQPSSSLRLFYWHLFTHHLAPAIRREGFLVAVHTSLAKMDELQSSEESAFVQEDVTAVIKEVRIHCKEY
eukprot:4865223-Pleurochrysis_carterae.AAC.4